MGEQGTLSVADVLVRAADLIEPEGAWTQEVYGRDERGQSISNGCLRNAVCFCAIGAIARAWGRSVEEVHDWEMVAIIPGVCSLGMWNDHPERTQAEVVAKLREAAALARGDPA